MYEECYAEFNLVLRNHSDITLNIETKWVEVLNDFDELYSPKMYQHEIVTASYSRLLNKDVAISTAKAGRYWRRPLEFSRVLCICDIDFERWPGNYV